MRKRQKEKFKKSKKVKVRICQKNKLINYDRKIQTFDNLQTMLLSIIFFVFGKIYIYTISRTIRDETVRAVVKEKQMHNELCKRSLLNF